MKDRARIYLIDLAHDSSLGLSSDAMPLQLGLIGAYCLQELGDAVEVRIFKFLPDLEAAVEGAPPFLVGVSNYMWNIHIGVQAIRVLKRRHPEIISVFGGPNYPDERESQTKWLQSHPAVDFYIYKDGEVPFAGLVEHLLADRDLASAKLACLPSVHAIHQGEACFGQTAPRVKDLTTIPSPYTTGLMDKFFEERLIPAIQTNRGCPFTCTFCTEGGSYYSKVNKSSVARAIEEVDYIQAHLEHTKTLRISDSNFGMYKQDIELCRHLGQLQERTGFPEYVMCATGKNMKERVLACNDLLNGGMRLSASVQSLSPEVLEAVRRDNISADGLMLFSDRTSDTDTNAYSELILALPGDTVERHEQSIAGLMEIGISTITQHQLSLIHGTEMNSPASRARYELRSGFRPMQRCVGRYELLGEEFHAVEIEEIAISTSTLSFEDYLAMRRLYLTVGMFYNDRIFGEIHALLRVLGLPTFGWIKRIVADIDRLHPEIRALYEEFTRDTKGELWSSPEQLIKDVVADIDHYSAGEIGGNLIYKFRSKSLVSHFEQLHAIAFAKLADLLEAGGVDCGEVFAELEHFSRCQKFDLLDVNRDVTERFTYDIPRLIQDADFARSGAMLEDFHYPVTVSIEHTDKQRETIERELSFYGRDIGGMAMLISRYPIKRFWRKPRVLDADSPKDIGGRARLQVVGQPRERLRFRPQCSELKMSDDLLQKYFEAGLERVPCNLCGADDTQVIATTERFGTPTTTVGCRRCGLIYLNPRWTEQSYDLFYAEDYRNLMRDSGDPARETMLRSRVHGAGILRSFGAFIKPGTRVLDVGCSTGGVLHAFREARGCDCVGIEPSIERSRYASEELGLAVHSGVFEEGIFEPQSFDLVMNLQTLNHMLDPAEFLSISHGLLRPGGQLLVEVQNFPEYAKRSAKPFQVDHCYYFSPQTLECMLRRSGFEPVSIQVDTAESALGVDQFMWHRSAFIHIHALLSRCEPNPEHPLPDPDPLLLGVRETIASRSSGSLPARIGRTLRRLFESRERPRS